MSGLARRIVLEGLGWLFVLGGIAALVLPGPGLLLLFAGLALLSQQYAWAERRLEPVKVQALKTAADSVASLPRIAFSSLFAALLVAAGVLWTLQPDVPGWWPVSDRLWLAGGVGVGVSLALSGVIALVMIGYSFRRFQVKGEQPPSLHDAAARDEP